MTKIAHKTPLCHEFTNWNVIKTAAEAGGGPHNPVDTIIASRPAATGSILSVSKIFLEFLDVAGIYWQQCIA